MVEAGSGVKADIVGKPLRVGSPSSLLPLGDPGHVSLRGLGEAAQVTVPWNRAPGQAASLPSSAQRLQQGPLSPNARESVRCLGGTSAGGSPGSFQ